MHSLTEGRTNKAKIKLVLRLRNKQVFNHQFFRASIQANHQAANFILETVPFDVAYIRVTYPLGKDYYNDGEYEDVETAKRVLSEFTELDLIRDMS